MWSIYGRHFPITAICANLRFLLATLTSGGVSVKLGNQGEVKVVEDSTCELGE